jgi:hypothetical protein
MKGDDASGVELTLKKSSVTDINQRRGERSRGTRGVSQPYSGAVEGLLDCSRSRVYHTTRKASSIYAMRQA